MILIWTVPVTPSLDKTTPSATGRLFSRTPTSKQQGVYMNVLFPPPQYTHLVCDKENPLSI